MCGPIFLAILHLKKEACRASNNYGSGVGWFVSQFEVPAIGIPLCLCCWKLVPSKGAALQIKTTFVPPIGCFLTFILSIINWDNYVLTQPSISANTVTHIYSCMKNQQTRLLGAQILKVPIFMPNGFEKLMKWLKYKYYVLVNIAIKDS